MNRPVTLAATAVAFLLACPLAAAQQPDTAQAQAAIRLLVKNYENAWNQHDAKALADQYAASATWVNWFGAYYKGRQDIQRHYEEVHKTYFKSSHYYTRALEDVTFIGPTVAIAHVRTGLTGDARAPGQTAEFRRTIVLTKEAGSWHILAGQNAKLGEGIK